jgi:hypothetical protein
MSPTKYKAYIDDGTREIPLYNQFNKLICKIHIRPSDISILDRYDDLVKNLETILAPLREMSINNDGTAKFEEDWQALKQAETDLKRRLNTLFDMDEADEIFATRNPFSSVGGNFFCANVIKGIGSVIVEAVNDEMELSRERTAPYLDDLDDEEPVNREVTGDDRTATAST